MGRIARSRLANACGCEDLTVRELIEKYTEDARIPVVSMCKSCGSEFVQRLDYARFSSRNGKSSTRVLCDECAKRNDNRSMGMESDNSIISSVPMNKTEKRIAAHFSPFGLRSASCGCNADVRPHIFRVSLVSMRDDPEYGRVKVTRRW